MGSYKNNRFLHVSVHTRVVVVLAVLSAVGILTVFTSCVERARSAAAGERTVEDPPAPDAPGRLNGELPADQPQPDTSPGPAPPSVDAPSVEPVAPRFLVPNARIERRVPADAVIGPLLDEAGGDHPGITRVLTRFFFLIAEPQSASAFVDTGLRTTVERILSEDVPAGVRVVETRFGLVRWIGADEVSVPVRLFTATAAIDGIMLLVNRTDSWYIADVLINFRELQFPRERTVQRLEPWFDRSPLVGP